MAEGGHEENCREFRGMGRAQVLLQVIEDFKRSREVGQGYSPEICQVSLQGTQTCVWLGVEAFLQVPYPSRWDGQGQSSASPTSPKPPPYCLSKDIPKCPCRPLEAPQHNALLPSTPWLIPQSPRHTPTDPNAPPYHEDLFPLAIMLLCACYSTTSPQSLLQAPHP